MKFLLVIASDLLVRESILKALREKRFQAIGVSSQREGLHQIRQRQFDGILCDMQLSDGDGYSALATIRSESALKHLPFFLLTEEANYTEMRYALDQGANDYLIKSGQNQDLVQSIEAYFRKHSQGTAPLLSAPLPKVSPDRVVESDHWLQPDRGQFHRTLQQLCVRTLEIRPELATVTVFVMTVTSYRSIALVKGQAISDRLMKQISQRLQQVLPHGHLTQLSEDQFGLALFDRSSVELNTKTQQQIQQLLQIVQCPYSMGDEELRPQITIGVSSFPHHSSHASELLLQAKIALQWCQHSRQSNYQIYSPSLAIVEEKRLTLTTELAGALERNELELYYQPQVNLTTGKMIGVEALVRWNHPDRGLVQPNHFIPIAEESGLIVPLGEWVLRTACYQAARWSRMGESPITISVNLSMRQIQQPDLVERIATILFETQLDPHRLVLELTESCLMEQRSATLRKLQQLKELGIKLALDDFGTGYSCLSYLNQLPIDELKIDRAFLNNLQNDRTCSTISSAIIAMAQSLDLHIVAEGAESIEQITFLGSSGCQIVQGFFYSQPLNAPDLELWWQQGEQPIVSLPVRRHPKLQANPVSRSRQKPLPSSRPYSKLKMMV